MRQFNISRYFHTLRYLKPVQVYGRLWFRLYRPRPDLGPPPSLRRLTDADAPVDWHYHPPCMIGPASFRFLNENGDLANGWDSSAQSRLWRYNLHYFDDLNADEAAVRQDWHRSLIDRWISENPPGRGSGWEPYPLSLRIVNWIKWGLAGNHAEEKWLHSLAVQIRYLERRLEYHLLGNHLFANAKALVFAGLFFEGREAAGWLARGLDILRREMAEQILSDGGHFERSPMYHAVILKDLLDLLNLFRVYSRVAPEGWQETGTRMLAWLQALTHPDGRIALFNDATFGIAPEVETLKAYAARLGLAPLANQRRAMTRLPETGYLRCELGKAVLLLDVAPVGPDYIPGHAHADTLNFELSLLGQRIIVDSGISTYEKNSERQRQRGTAAHNTVTIDDEDSSEVWDGFRVARRAHPFALKIVEKDEEIIVRCGHDGYRRLPGKPVHHRQWLLNKEELRVRDWIEGGFQNAVARYHFHPDMEVELTQADAGKVKLPGGGEISFRVVHGLGRLEVSTYHPGFNVNLANRCLSVAFSGAEAEVVFDAHSLSDR